MSLEIQVILCECNSAEHQIILRKFNDEPEEMYLEVHLRTYRNFFQRLWYGLKYAFGYKCRFGAWDEIILGQESQKKLQQFIANEPTT
jgi:hypothetical protein